MIVHFSYCTSESEGRMVIDADPFMDHVSSPNYRKWVKLFARFGSQDDHRRVLALLEDKAEAFAPEIQKLENETEEWQQKAEHKVPTVLAPDYCRKELQKAQLRLKVVKNKQARYCAMHDLLEELTT